jgi:hypothetical protein
MQLATAEREVQTGGDLGFEVDYTISTEDIAHVMWVLRTGLYTRKALAVLREYSSNGWDAHQESGIGDRPLDIQVPTWAKPTFICRDYGPGLPRKGIVIFAQFGRSTKRGAKANCPDCATAREFIEDEEVAKTTYCPECEKAVELARKAVGALGIGSKAGFCIGDTFTVTSWHDGTKSIYRSAIGQDNKGKLTLMHEEDCGDETGIEIKVPVPQGLVHEFEREARGLFRHMRPQPNINIYMPKAPTGLSLGYIRSDLQSNWIGVMGCVPYRIDLDQLQGPLGAAGIWEPLQKLGGAVYLPIGMVEFAANREELQYTEVTVKALVEQLKQLLQQYIDDALTTLNDGIGSGWERRHKAIFMSSGLGLKLPRRLGEWAKPKVPLWSKEKGEAPKTFTLLNSDKQSTMRIPVGADTRLLIKDPTDLRKMVGWALSTLDIIVVPVEGQTIEAAEAELLPLLEKVNLDGVGVGRLTERAWYAPSTSGGRRTANKNAKHRQRTFEMTDRSGSGTLSKNWTQAKPPEEPHCYFIINRFLYKGRAGFYTTVSKDMALAKVFDMPFPKVYGYKTTEKQPVLDADITNGTPYMKWRREFFAELMTPKLKQDIRDLEWSRLFQSMPYQFSGYNASRRFHPDLPGLIEKLSEALGVKHPLVRYFVRYTEAKRIVAKFPRHYASLLDSLNTMYPSRNKRTAPQCALDRLLKTYPMLTLKVVDDDNMHVFMTHTKLLIRYITETDRGSNLSVCA